jgi:hypothetical protein
MSAPRSIEFAGTDEELEKHLLEFARAADGWVGRDRKRGGWQVAAGHFLSTNPNTVAWRIRVQREATGLSFHPSAIALPWTRQKVSRIVAWREGQLADYLTTRVRGRGPEKFDPARLREPFAAYGSGPEAITASFAWVVAGGLAGLAVAFLLATVASLPLMVQAAGEIAERSRIIEESGVLPLPSRAEREAMGFGSALGAAAVFAVPLAFLAAFVHTVCLALSEAWARGSRLPQASFVFLAVLGTVAFFGHLPLLSVPLALLLPAGAHLGYTLLWGRRGERVREGPRANPLVVAAGVILAGALLGGVVPTIARGDDLSDRFALFRDKALLGNGIGRAAARFYYRHTLVAADPLKEFYVHPDPSRAQRGLRTARVEGPGDDLLRSLDFVVVPARVAGRCDVLWPPQAGAPATRDEAALALDALSKNTYRGAGLREVYGLAWHFVYYGAPAAALLVFAAVCCPFVSIMYRAMTPKAATIALAVCLFSTVGLMMFGGAAVEGITRKLKDLRERPTPERIAEGLADEVAPIRHEAAYRAFRLAEVPAKLADPLIRASSDADPRIRLWAVAALGKTRDPRALPVLLDRLDDESLFVRYRAAEGLGFLGDARAVERLKGVMKKGSWYEGTYALQALRRIEPATY